MSSELAFIRRAGIILGLFAMIAMISIVLVSTSPRNHATISFLGMGATVWIGMFMALGWLLFWIYQFIDLMASPPQRFVGSYDKMIWAALFILVAPLAPVVFWLWKLVSTARDR